MATATRLFANTHEYAKALPMTLKSPPQDLEQLLLDVALKRDKNAFSQLFKLFAPKIKHHAQSKLGSQDAANDIVQETMTNVWRKAHLFNPNKGAVNTWVYTIMRNVTFDALRKIQSNREDVVSEDIWPLIDIETVKPMEEDHLSTNLLMKHINELSPEQQAVVKGIYFSGISQEQLAIHLDLPLGTVKSRLRLAMAKLKAIGAHL
ncbi:sigma-70 family RNA polymerase sigma factor [Parashewanella curva]|uniref:Sigma-70 family RNA polymerase sigma factor n=1 Tax=Parashewanella curva TaxID=2338552 RepID=A0A3L8Q1T1_9GAMM|nr:sigma-70 family RNA polymerase sigma factor [Parashewanella curva]RLV61616.1 sigma-70 family RNA polymerase sigma factor [Parashewanella curva]